MTDQTDRIRKRLDVVEAQAQAGADVKSGIPVSPSQWGPLVQDYLGGAIGAYCAAHNPAVVLAQVEDYRQQIEDAEAALARHVRVTPACQFCERCEVEFGDYPCPDALLAQNRLDRLDTLTALMVGESADVGDS